MLTFLQSLQQQRNCLVYINWSIAGFKRLLKRGGFEYRETDKVRGQYQRMASPLYAFVEDCIEVDSQKWISKEDFYNKFVDYCKSNNLPVSSKIVVGRELPEHIHVVGERMRTAQGRLYVWKGIRYKTEEEREPEDDDERKKEEFSEAPEKESEQ